MQDNPYKLFEVTGIEAEYMIVDRDSLAVLPAADKIFFEKTGNYASDFTWGDIEWSNELVNHVVELKTHSPVSSLHNVDHSFQKSIREINQILEKYNGMLLPTASHPFMDPLEETVLWPHEYSKIYRIFDSVFSCRSHGWANLQSVHINLPFKNDAEFGKLHAAVRIVLPLIPAVAASSPFREARLTGFLDSRMESYFYHERKIPSLMGRLIPEPIFSKENYDSLIFSPIIEDFKKYDPDHIMEHHFLNSRGAIARFDRGAIEIRVMDIQECPLADLAVVQAINLVLQNLVSEKYCSMENQKNMKTEDLLKIFMNSLSSGSELRIDDLKFLSCFGMTGISASLRDIWNKLYSDVKSTMDDPYRNAFEAILKNGNLAERMIRKTGNNPSDENLKALYRQLSVCLVENIMFDPDPAV